jgi:hypothetical protein
LGNHFWFAAGQQLISNDFNDLQQSAKTLCVLFGAVFIAVLWRNGHGLNSKPYKRCKANAVLRLLVIGFERLKKRFNVRCCFKRQHFAQD